VTVHDPEQLDTRFYASTYPDLAALSDRELRSHWKRVGQREGRYPNVEAVRKRVLVLTGLRFDATAYLALNPDLTAAGITTEPQALFHFCTHGFDEGRRYESTSVIGVRAHQDNPEALEPVRKAWPQLQPFHRRDVDWHDVISAASRVLGRPMEAQRQAIDPWLLPLSPVDRVAALLDSEEKERPERALNQLNPENFVLYMFEKAFGRMPSPADFDALVTTLDYGDARRESMLLQRLADGISEWPAPAGAEAITEDSKNPSETEERAASQPVSDLSFLLLGTGRMISRRDWDARVRQVREHPEPVPRLGPPPPRLAANTTTTPLISVVASIFRPGEFLVPYLENMIQQTVFDRAEILCVLVCLSPQELQIAREYSERFPNIRLFEFDDRLPIYAAWNFAVRHAKGTFLTNANVDDRRRPDSFEIQAATLVDRPWADVVYQDVLYTLEAEMPWEEVQQLDFRTDMPGVTPWSLLGMNLPHNGPMWRRSLHDELGYFDEDFQSAGDYEFWLRCVAADKVFLKVRDAHVSYYVNPNGLSTRPGGAGLREAIAIGMKYSALLGYPEPPEYVAVPDPQGPRLSRADRLTLSVCDQLQAMRGGMA
jgi:hypothetical protein